VIDSRESSQDFVQQAKGLMLGAGWEEPRTSAAGRVEKLAPISVNVLL
jgi:hypothetical protein